MEKLMGEVQALFDAKELSVNVVDEGMRFHLQSSSKYQVPSVGVYVGECVDGPYTIQEVFVVRQAFLHLIRVSFPWDRYFIHSYAGHSYVEVIPNSPQVVESRSDVPALVARKLREVYDMMLEMERLHDSLLESTSYGSRVRYIGGNAYQVRCDKFVSEDPVLLKVEIYLPTEFAFSAIRKLGKSHWWKLHPVPESDSKVSVLEITCMVYESVVDTTLEELNEIIFEEQAYLLCGYFDEFLTM